MGTPIRYFSIPITNIIVFCENSIESMRKFEIVDGFLYAYNISLMSDMKNSRRKLDMSNEFEVSHLSTLTYL